MELCHLVPHGLLHAVYSDFDFVEAAWLDYKPYRVDLELDHHAEESHQWNRPLVLDNSVHLFKKPMDSRYLWSLAEKLLTVRAEVTLIVPDYKNNRKDTLKLLGTFLRMRTRTIDAEHLRIMVVGQGRDYAEWSSCCHDQLRMVKEAGFLVTLGIPYQTPFGVENAANFSELPAQWGLNRAEVVHALLAISEMDALVDRIHLLGSNNPRELLLYRDLKQDLEIFHDTSMSYSMASRGYKMTYESGWPEEFKKKPDLILFPWITIPLEFDYEAFHHNVLLLRRFSTEHSTKEVA